MMRKVDQNEAQERLPELIREVARGVDVVIVAGDGGKFRLVEVKPASMRKDSSAGVPSFRGVRESVPPMGRPSEELLREDREAR